jgi:hypothetical protein
MMRSLSGCILAHDTGKAVPRQRRGKQAIFFHQSFTIAALAERALPR